MLYFSPYKTDAITATNIRTRQYATSKYSTILGCYSVSPSMQQTTHDKYLPVNMT